MYGLPESELNEFNKNKLVDCTSILCSLSFGVRAGSKCTWLYRTRSRALRRPTWTECSRNDLESTADKIPHSVIVIHVRVSKFGVCAISKFRRTGNGEENGAGEVPAAINWQRRARHPRGRWREKVTRGRRHLRMKMNDTSRNNVHCSCMRTSNWLSDSGYDKPLHSTPPTCNSKLTWSPKHTP